MNKQYCGFPQGWKNRELEKHKLKHKLSKKTIDKTKAVC